jgi:asparagine synthase (glutamine-hydrolysing)
MGFQPFHTHERSRLEHQPGTDARGNMVALDGRIDNYSQLTSMLDLPNDTADSSILLAAFERWGADCFAKLVGDWAVALWSVADRSLYLARDHAGTRSLYFELRGDRLVWSTFLDTFLSDGKPRTLDKHYMVLYLASQPLRGRTPYEGISLVPAAHYVKFHGSAFVSVSHWQWMVKETIHYKTDAEYEHHFVSLFQQSVERRTGSGAPILAELSGGMDSSSIVCVSDHIRTEAGNSSEQLLETVSYHDYREPELNDMQFVEVVERQRGHRGIHIESSYVERTFQPVESTSGRYFLPGADSSSPLREQRFSEAVGADKYRAILSGKGGDELMGGVPDPLPELGDYLVGGRALPLLSTGLSWCLRRREPLLFLFWGVVQYVVNIYLPQKLHSALLPAWMNHTELEAASFFPGLERAFLSPSRIENGRTWWMIQETLPHLYPPYWKRYEYRYPFLDRDLVDFLFRIPREQLLRPRHKRSLQRRALRNVLPEKVLARSRKGFASRGISLALQKAEPNLERILDGSIATRESILSRERLMSDFREYANGIGLGHATGLMRFLDFEAWLNSSRTLLAL